VTIWQELSREESVVLANALEEAPLSDVIADYLGHREDGDVWRFSADVHAIAAQIPRFTPIVRDMIDRDLVELVRTDQPDAGPLTGAEIDAALADRANWLPGTGGSRITLWPTDHTTTLDL
jgi:hypothetical protein